MTKVRNSNPSQPTTSNTPHLLGTPEPHDTITRITIELPTSLILHYEDQGIAWDRTVEHEIASRLQKCKNYVSTSPLYFTDDERRELESALGHNCSNPGVVLQQLKHAVTLEVGEIKIELPPNVQQRLKSRVFRGQDYATVVRKQVVDGLKRFCGLLPQ